MAEAYLGGHTVLSRASSWVSRGPGRLTAKKRHGGDNYLRRRNNLFRREVMKLIGCTRTKAEEIRRLYIELGWIEDGRLANLDVLMHPRILRRAEAAVRKRLRAASLNPSPPRS
jgi:hypothetical protein